MLNLKNEHREIFTRNFPAVLDSIMRRRHQIAHEGDCIFNKDKIKLRKIARKDVDHWSKIVFQVVGLIVIFVGAEKIDKSKATT